MEKPVILANEISEISKLNAFIEEVRNEFSLSPDADITLSADEREIGGLGIFLIRQIKNEVKFERVEGKNVLTLLKRLSI